MEKENRINGISNEKSLNKGDFSREYGLLNQLKGYINFDVYEDPVLCESRFYSSLAWYIETLKQGDGWEKTVQKFIDSIIKFNGSEIEKFLYIEKYLIGEKQKRYKLNNMDFDVDLLNSILGRIDKEYEKSESVGKIKVVMTGVKSFMIPQRYFKRFSDTGMEARVMKENKKNFLNSIKEQNRKAEELKKRL